MNGKLIENGYFLSGVQNFPTHVHNCYEIIFIKKGEAFVTVGDKSYNVSSPSLILIGKLEGHSIKVFGEIYERYYLNISPKTLTDSIRNYSLISVLSNRPTHFSHIIELGNSAGEAERLFEKIISIESSPFIKEAETACLTEILLLIYKLAPTLFSAFDDITLSAVWDIQCEFEKNYHEKWTLNSVSEKLHLSPSYLSHIFKDITGYSIIRYLLMCRVAQAKRLLSETDMSVSSIVAEIGFSDACNFGRIFKKEVGLSPLQYRKKHRTGELL